ncbi:MAG: DUF4089 domain-containing protein [Leptolyngbya sp. SIO4C5]|uniref:DUF4089 domain-containing protein n=1 Tax=Sphaerothrix gracilis TaxID=3151835 RepID=UPI0013C1080A|nr:DUF4089 domain-containing protein [Leptolyngbya sp. SIO4C5]
MSNDSSFDAAAYVTLMAQVLNLPIPEDIKASVTENFQQIQAIAQPVIQFPLPDDLEAAPIFKP